VSLAVCQRVNERQYVLLSSVETDEHGQPAAFSGVLEAMMSGQTGQRQITENARRADYHDGVLVWTPVTSSRYYYAPVTGKRFVPFRLEALSPQVKFCKVYCVVRQAGFIS